MHPTPAPSPSPRPAPRGTHRAAARPDADSVLALDAPAADWAGGTLPIGNGRVGATFWGDPVHGVI